MIFLKVPKVEKGLSDELYVKMKDLKDGIYTVELEVKNMMNSPDFKMLYTFECKESKVKPIQQAERTLHNDLTTLLETGRDYVLIQGEKLAL